MATCPYEWQSLASPSPSNSSGSSLGAPQHRDGARPYGVDPFYGSYPHAPHMRPIELPETGSPMPVYASLGSASSRSRTMSVPPPEITGLGIYGIPSPPTSPQSSSRSTGISSSSSGPVAHPLLRAYSDRISARLVYNVLRAPSGRALCTTEGAMVNPSDLNFAATHPACPSLRISVLLFPGGGYGHAARRFLWDITLTPSRRSSAPPTTASILTLGDALASLHLSLLAPVGESELRQLPPADIQSARAMFAARCASHPNTPPVLVRADFLYGCTEFAGLVRNTDYSFSLRLASPSARA